MNLLIHDIACAIERDATEDAVEADRGRGRAGWIAEWQARLDEQPYEPVRELRPIDE
jgi:hypothetical protein